MRHALFAGTFDPPTFGHLEVIKRAKPLFDKLTVAVGRDTRKAEPLLTRQARVKLLKELTKVDVVEMNGLLADFVKEMNVTVLLRSVRSSEDIYHEFSMAEANKRMCSVETLFLMGDPQYAYVSSSLVREIAHLGGNLEHFLPPLVIKQLKK